jgi:hypothetical protein
MKKGVAGLGLGAVLTAAVMKAAGKKKKTPSAA